MPSRAQSFVAFALLALAATWLGGVRHDYVYYIEQWQLVLAGADPWSTNNAYGPLHNAFALLLPLHPLAPKLAQTLLLLIAIRGLMARLPAERATSTHLGIALLFNGLIWIAAFWYGNNDALVAALVLFAVLARLDGRMLLAGLCLGLATLDKFYPALLIPFFALSARKLEPRLVLSALLTIAAGLLVGAMIWGQAMVESLVFGVSRDPKILSILKYISVMSEGQSWEAGVDLLVRLNALFVLAAWVIAIAVAWRQREHWLLASCWGLALVLITYKVGHQQFWVTWLALVAALPILAATPAFAERAQRLSRASWPFALFLGIFQIGFEALEPRYYRGPLLPVRDGSGLVALALVGVMLLIYFRPASRPAA